MAGTEKELSDLIAGMQRERHQVEPFYRAAARLCTPLYNYWGSDGQTYGLVKQLECIYSNSGIRAVERMAAFLLGMATPPSERWFKLEDRTPAVAKDHSAQVWYSDLTEDVEMQLAGSFYRAIRPANLEMSISYGVVYSFEYRDKSGRDTGRVAFRHRPSHSVWYVLDVFGAVDCVAAKWEMTKKEAEYFFPGVDITAVEPSLKSGSDRAMFWNIIRRESDDDKIVKRTEDMPFRSYWMNTERSKIIEETGHNEMPYHIFRWEDVPGNTYSVGPVYAILPEIRGANQAREDLLRALAWSANPPVLMPTRGTGVGRPTIGPGKRVYGGTNKDGKPMYQTMDGVANPGPMIEATVDAESRVADGLLTSQFDTYANKEMTATESANRAQERAQTLGPYAVALHMPLESVLDRVVKMRIRAGRVADPPQILMEHGDYTSQMVGPLAQAVRQGTIARTLSAMGHLAFLAEVDPTVFDVVDTQAAARQILTLSGVDPDLQRSEGDVEARAQAQEAEQAALAEAQGQQAQAGALRDVGAAVRDISSAAS